MDTQKPIEAGKQPSPRRVILIGGGKGGVGKTEVAVNLATWLMRQGTDPTLIDLGSGNSDRGSLASFLPQAYRLDCRKAGAFDHLFKVVGAAGGLALADIGDSASIRDWLEDMAEDCRESGIRFTSIWVTTNDPASISATVQSACNLPEDIDHIIVLNEMRSPKCAFGNWHDNREVARFIESVNPTVLWMRARIEEFQAEVRRHNLTFESIIDRDFQPKPKYFRYLKNIARARAHRRQIYAEFDRASELLLPDADSHRRIRV